jgi:hypothetical protein
VVELAIVASNFALTRLGMLGPLDAAVLDSASD